MLLLLPLVIMIVAVVGVMLLLLLLLPVVGVLLPLLLLVEVAEVLLVGQQGVDVLVGGWPLLRQAAGRHRGAQGAHTELLVPAQISRVGG